MSEISPFVKWAGGKGQLLEELIQRFPHEYNNYFEPFVGGGALLFGAQPHNAFINDINQQLINVYKQLQNDAKTVLDIITNLDKENCDKEVYLSKRTQFNEKISNNIFDAECAALFIWINKHAFNGLYRVNKQGLYNVPYNNKKGGRSCIPNNILGIGEYLKNVSISCLDFEEFCKNVQKGDFVYFDSPYVPVSTTADFTSYTKEDFKLEDHQRLANLFKNLDKKGAYVMLSNNDVELVRDLYAGYSFTSLEVKRLINRNANDRVGKEVIITNY